MGCCGMERQGSKFLFQDLHTLPAVTSMKAEAYGAMAVTRKSCFWTVNNWLFEISNLPTGKFEEHTVLRREVRGDKLGETLSPFFAVDEPYWVQVSGEF